MKNFSRILLLYTFISNFSNAQTNIYHPFPDSNATWTCYFFAGMAPIHTERYTYMMTGDTVIGAFSYHKITIPFLDVYGDTIIHFQVAGYQGGLRQDTAVKKVYFILPGDTIEKTLYDFTYQPGDPYHGYMRNPSSLDTVLGIDSVLIGSDYRKVWLVGQQGNLFSGFRVIEGMGYDGGLLEQNIGGVPDGPVLDLNCFQQDGVTLYLFGTFSCDIVDYVNESSLKNYSSSLTLSPNPVSSQFVIRIENSSGFVINAIEIYNSLGSSVYSSAVNCNSCPPSPGSYGGQSIVHCESFPPGVYFVKATAGEKTAFGKFIKN